MQLRDKHGFENFYCLYGQKIFDYAFLLTQCAATSEDIRQEVFLKVWLRKDQWNQIENFSGWIFTITRNCTFDYLRKKKKERCDLAEYYNTMRFETLWPPDSVEEEKQKILQKAIDRLPRQQRAVCTLRTTQKLKRNAIAAVLNISPFTVKNNLQKATQNLKKMVREMYEQ